jgi:hypothetical protein
MGGEQYLMETDNQKELPSSQWELIVIGAGVSGMAARERWLQSGRSCLTLEKSRGVGGRAAIKRIRDGVFADLGIQSVPTQEGRFRDWLKKWGGRLALNPSNQERDSWIHPDGINQFVKRISIHARQEHSPILFQKKVIEVRHPSSPELPGFELILESGEILSARHVAITAPLPQALGMPGMEHLLPSSQFKDLSAVAFTPCFALVIVENAPLGEMLKVAEIDYGLSGIAEVTEQRSKGLNVSERVWVVHSTGEWAQAHWSLADEEVRNRLFEGWRSLFGVSEEVRNRVDVLLHRWRFSRVKNPVSRRFHRTGEGARGFFYWIGDAFGPSNEVDFERAYFSGVTAAEDLIEGTPKIQPS